MPEGHVLHRLADAVVENFSGRNIASSSPQGRFTGAALLDGDVLKDAETWGKHLFVAFQSTQAQVHIHLGIYGTLRFLPGEPPVVGQVRWRLTDGESTADLRGPAACALLDPPEVQAIVDRLGPDPLRADADPQKFIDRVLRSRAPIATLLMDQSVIAGTGNIFRAEVLFRLGIDPSTPGKAIGAARAREIWDDMVTLMEVGLERGRIDTVRPEHEPAAMGRPPRVDDHGGEVYVYRRHGQPCWVCGSPILTKTIGGRNLFWCPTCQAGA
ncbi:DNA-formamidopyrimidine glycosylase family protein [Actinomycetaceae bacterium L2_0104]